jgi:hypothetical protein
MVTRPPPAHADLGDQGGRRPGAADRGRHRGLPRLAASITDDGAAVIVYSSAREEIVAFDGAAAGT